MSLIETGILISGVLRYLLTWRNCREWMEELLILFEKIVLVLLEKAMINGL